MKPSAMASNNNKRKRLSAGFFGRNWVEKTSLGAKVWLSAQSSANGKFLIGIHQVYQGGFIPYSYQAVISQDGGQTWSVNYSVIGTDSPDVISSGMSDDGRVIAVSKKLGGVYTSTNSGQTWGIQNGAGNRSWSSIDVSPDGTKIAALDGGTAVYISTDSGVNWNLKTVASSVRSVFFKDNDALAVDRASDGYYSITNYFGNSIWGNWSLYVPVLHNKFPVTRPSSLINNQNYLAAIESNYITISTNSGNNWTQKTDLGSKNWSSISSSSDGLSLVATVSGGYLYTSNYV